MWRLVGSWKQDVSIEEALELLQNGVTRMNSNLFASFLRSSTRISLPPAPCYRADSSVLR